MEHLEHYLEPLSLDNLEFFARSADKNRIGSRLHIHTAETGLPALDKVSIALIGVPEERNAYDNVGCSLAPDEIRKQFYQLFRMPGMPETADLGNLRAGKTCEDTYQALADLLGQLLEAGIVPLILGGSQDLTSFNFFTLCSTQQATQVVSSFSLIQ